MEVLSSRQIHVEVLRLIETAQKVLVLVTPYFDPWPMLVEEVRRAAKRPGIKVILLLRGGEDKAKQQAAAQVFRGDNVVVEYLAHLHAKVYCSESQAIATSMNLVQTSALNSWELALRATKEQDDAVFKSLAKAIDELLNKAVQDRVSGVKSTTNKEIKDTQAGGAKRGATAPKALAAPAPRATPMLATAAALRGALLGTAGGARKPTKAASHGCCLRCGASVPFNTERPLCASCYAKWAKFGDPDYQEAHCHRCGKARSTSVSKPLCRPCWEATT